MENLTGDKQQSPLTERSDAQIRLALRGLASEQRMRCNPGMPPTYHERLLEEAANRLQRLERLATLIGLVAPGGTAPRTAIEELYKQSAVSAEESPAVLALRTMLQPHWGEWTPTLREAEGMPPEPIETT